MWWIIPSLVLTPIIGIMLLFSIIPNTKLNKFIFNGLGGTLWEDTVCDNLPDVLKTMEEGGDLFEGAIYITFIAFFHLVITCFIAILSFLLFAVMGWLILIPIGIYLVFRFKKKKKE